MPAGERVRLGPAEPLVSTLHLVPAAASTSGGVAKPPDLAGLREGLRRLFAPGGTPRRSLALLLFLLFSLALAPAAASADPLTVDFETGPALGTPVTSDYVGSTFVQFVQNDSVGGFRPYRRSAPGLAHSGTVVADVGADVCFQDTGGNCEFVNGGTTGRLTRTASAVTLFAGEFDPSSPPGTARLTAFRADGTVAGTSADVTIDNTGFNKQITVSSAAGDIAYFHLATVGPAEGDLGFDDLTLTFPAHSLPDVAPSVTTNVVTLLQGTHGITVPIGLTRLNGSNGPVVLSVSGLPPGVDAPEFAPNPAPGEAAGLGLVASSAAPTFDVPVQITISVDPQGNANVAPAVRTVQLSVKVVDPYELKLGAGASSDVALPDCAPVDVPIVVARDGTFASGSDPITNSVVLDIEAFPPGVSAQIEPSDTVKPGGDFFAARTVEFSRLPGAVLPATVTVRATALGQSGFLPDRFLSFTVHRAAPAAALQSTIGLTPRFRGDGTRLRIDGNGFCPGTSVLVGNSSAATSATVQDDHTLLFNVPRLATSGPVTIVPPNGEPSYPTANSLNVSNVRNSDGFQFSNYPYGSLSISELTRAFGADDLFIKINPCWPFGDCTIVTGILNPIAALDWGVLDVALHESNGHCFGISRAVQQLVSHKEPYASFTTGSSVFSIPGPGGPGSSLSSYLDAEHALQGSDEFLSAWFDRNPSINAQLDRLGFEFDQFREPIITLQHGSSGHAVIAYNERTTPVGVDIDVYDNNGPVSPTETQSPALHAFEEDASVIHINQVTGTWTFDLGGGDVWTGHNDGSLFVMPQNVIPDDPSLPGLGTLGGALESLVFGSPDGSVRTAGGSSGARYLPPLDDHAVPGGAGWWLSRDAKHPLEASLRPPEVGVASVVKLLAGR